jgi:hypothetical protein
MTAMTESSVPLMSPDSPDTLGGAFRGWIVKASPLILLAMSAATVGTRIWLADFGWVDLAIVGALLVAWPFIEWLIHVNVLHWKPKKIGKWTIDSPTARKHRTHHRNPWRVDIIFIPLHTYLYTIPVQLLLWIGLAPRLSLAFTGLAFSYLMTLHYEWVHYLVHTRYKPRSAYYQRLWRNHRLHHCKNEHYWMGVTMLAGDKVLGTQPKPTDVPTSDTCRTLGVEETLGA